MDLAAVMTAIADTIRDGGVMDRVYDWPASDVTAPACVVGYPSEFDFDMTFGRGSDRAVFPVYLIVGKVSEKHSRDSLSGYIKDATGIKGVLDGDLGGAVQSARLTNIEIETIAIGGTEYVAARGDLEVVA